MNPAVCEVAGCDVGEPGEVVEEEKVPAECNALTNLGVVSDDPVVMGYIESREIPLDVTGVVVEFSRSRREDEEVGGFEGIPSRIPIVFRGNSGVGSCTPVGLGGISEYIGADFGEIDELAAQYRFPAFNRKEWLSRGKSEIV